MDMCICGHSERDHSPTGECHAAACRCKRFEPVPEIARQQSAPGPAVLEGLLVSANTEIPRMQPDAISPELGSPGALRSTRLDQGS